MSFTTSKQNHYIRMGTKICVYVVRVPAIEPGKNARLDSGNERVFFEHALFPRILFDIPV